MKKIATTILILLPLLICSCASGPSYTVNLDPNGGEGKITEQELSIEDAEPLPKNIFTRSGYIFLGWDTNDDGVFDYADEEILNSIEEADVFNLKAIWVPETQN